MDTSLKYVPVFRSKQQEINVLKTFRFDDEIYPYLEIIKELDRLPRQSSSDKQVLLFDKKQGKTFESCYSSVINSISAKKVFIDLPTHLLQSPNMKSESLKFLRTVITKREQRTAYLTKLKHLSDKIIPVISSYQQISGEVDSINLQAQNLKNHFPSLAYRIMIPTYEQDIQEVKICIRESDYIFIDYENDEIDENDWEALDIKKAIEDINAHKIIHRYQIPDSMTMTGLEHNQRIETIDNSLPFIHKKLGGHSFSDYVGIKKDNITDGGVQSPGFIFYDAVQNSFFGYRYRYGGHKRGETRPNLSEFETTIVPAVLDSKSVARMKIANQHYLDNRNWGWNTLNRIESGKENGKNAAKFKRISMEHYLHCIQQKLRNKEI
jgi:septum formation topological specificity factor MinE